MSNVELTSTELTSAELTSVQPVRSVVGPESAGSVRANLRFFANELRITFFRRRNQLLLLVVALFPLLIGIGLKAAAPHGGGGGGNGPASGGAAFFNQDKSTACDICHQPIWVACAKY